MSARCGCSANHTPRLVVLTGGPGAGKTATLEVLKNEICHHVVVLPEVATMLWTGGFPRRPERLARRAAQRAIARVQFEIQRIAIEDPASALIMCDRGSLDGLAYWPGDPAEYFDDLDTTEERELARYATVIHMRSATRDHGYTPTVHRVESPEQASEIDERLLAVWRHHPRRFVIESNPLFVTKLEEALTLIRAEIPACCR